MNNKLNIAITVFTCGLILLPGCSRETFRSQALDSDFSYVNDGAGMSIVDDREIKKHLVDMDFVYLIEHLDDPTTGGVVYVSDDGESTPVPMGFICLDILLAGIGHDHVVRLDSNDDGLHANVDGEYYFPPDILTRPGAAKRMSQVKKKWAAIKPIDCDWSLY